MALVLQDRVRELSTSTGTGTVTLSGAYVEYRTFASCVPNGSIVYYCINNTAAGLTEWEVGYGTYSSNTLTRTSVLSSTNANALVNFSAGDKEVFITQPAGQAVYQETNGDVLIPNGILTVIGANATNPTFSATLGEFVSNVPGFSQLFVQNQSNDANASSDLVAYNNLGDGVSYFVDTGINSSTYNSVDYPIFQANDAYLFNAGNVAGTGAAGDISRLMIGTSTANSNVVIFGGSVNVNAVITTFVASTKDVNFANNVNVTSNVSAANGVFTTGAYVSANTALITATNQVTSKAYVDAAVATGFVVHDPVNLATVAVLSGTPIYNNGAAGVGATLTAAGVGTLSVDGQNAASGFRILVQSQANAAHNGVYSVTVEGTVGTPYVLTRATDFDTAAAGEIANNAYFFVSAGDTLNGDSFVLSQLAAITVGTTALPFTQFAAQLTYTGTAPINVSGTTISLTGIVPVANGGTNLSSYTTGDTIYANATNTLTRRPIGAVNTVLVSNGSVPDWGTVALGSANAVSGTLGPTNGGTGQSTYTLGDIVYANGTNTLAKLAGQTTTTQKFLSQTGNGVNSAAPVWDTIPAASITGILPVANGGTGGNTASITLFNNITGFGTTGTTGTTTANLVFSAGPTFVGITATGGLALSGSAASNSTFHTTQTSGNLTIGGTSGTATIIVGRSTVSQQTDIQAGATASGSTKTMNIGTGGLVGSTTAIAIGSANGTTITLNGTVNGTISNATSAATATNIGSGTAGAVPYQSGSGATTFVSIGGSGTILTSNGTAPVWTSPSSITANVASFVATTDDTTTATAVYPTWVSAASGNNAVKVSSTKITFTPSTGTLQTTLFSGSGANLTALNGSNVASGTVGISYGGTGQTTANGAFNALVPSQTGNSGKFLTTNGSNSSWGTVSVSAAGSSTQIQYNNGGAFAASANLTFDSTTNQFTAPNVVASNGLVVNNMTVGSSFSVPAGYSASSVGPITVGSGAIVTLPSGSRWVVL